MRYFGAADLVVDQKPDGSPVTQADREVEPVAVSDRRRSLH
jgi:fructose-1,6-bisphosphatase/inositol monophosphatase family enzyme